MSSSSEISAGKAFITLTVKNEQFIRKLEESSTLIGDFVNRVQGKINAISDATAQSSMHAVKKFMAWGTGIIAASAPFTMFGDKLDKMAIRTGMTTKYLSEMSHVASQCGSSLDQLDNAMKGLQNVMLQAQKGSAEAIDSFERLGLSYEYLNGLNPQGKFQELIKGLQTIEDPTERAGLAMKIFGEAGRSLIPIIDAGEEGIDKLRKQAEELGISMSEKSASQAAALSDALDRLKTSALGFSLKLGEVLAPGLINSLEFLKKIVIKIQMLPGILAPAINWIAKLGNNAMLLAAGWVTLNGVIWASTKVISGWLSVITRVNSYVAILYGKLSPSIQIFKNVAASASEIRILAASYDTVGAASNRLLTALNLPIDKRANQIASGLLLMSHKETAAAATNYLNAKLNRLSNAYIMVVTRIKAAVTAVYSWMTAVRSAGGASTLSAGLLFLKNSFMSLPGTVFTYLSALSKLNLAQIAFSVQAKTSALVTSTLSGVMRVCTGAKKLFSAATLRSVASNAAHTASLIAERTATIALSLGTKGLAASYLSLSAAMKALNINPFYLGVTAIIAVLIGLCTWLERARSYTAKFNDEQEKMGKRDLEARQLDSNKMKYLEALSGKDSINDKEMKKAKQLLSELNGKYGDIGISIDENTKKIVMATDAQDKFNEAVRKQAAERIKNQIAEAEKNVQEAQKENDAAVNNYSGFWGGAKGVTRQAAAWVTAGYVDTTAQAAEKQVQKSGEQLRERMKDLNDLRKQLRDIEGGDTNQALGMSESESLNQETSAIAGENGAIEDKSAKDAIEELDKKIAEAQRKIRRDGQTDTENRIEDIREEAEAYKELLAARIAAEEAKPESEQDVDLLEKLRPMLSAVDTEMQERIDEVNKNVADSAAKKSAKEMDEARKNVWKTEREMAGKEETELERTISEIDEQTKSYREQLLTLQDLINAKENKNGEDLQTLADLKLKIDALDAKDKERKDEAVAKYVEKSGVNQFDMYRIPLQQELAVALASGNQEQAAMLKEQLASVDEQEDYNELAKLTGELGDAMDALSTAQESGNEVAIAEAMKVVGEIQGKYDEALGKASENMASKIDKGMEKTAKYTSSGTFSAFEAAALGQSDHEKKIAENSVQTVYYLRRLDQKSGRRNASCFA